MTNDNGTGVTRREFVSTATGAAVGTILAASAPSLRAQGKRRYAIVGTGVRGIGMWGTPIARRYADTVEFAGLSDINPIRLETARKIDRRLSCDEGKPIRIGDLVNIPT